MSPAPNTLADIDRAIAELQERRAAEIKMDEYREEFRAFLAERPVLNRIEVLRLAREMPGTPERGEPVKSRHAGQSTTGKKKRPDNGDLGQAMKVARVAKGWSRGKMADRLGVHVSSVGFWERGHGWPEVKHHKKLAALLNMPVTKFVPPAGPRAKGANNGRYSGRTPRSAAHAKVGKAIAAARAAKGLTPYEVADKMGVSHNAVYGWEAGYWCPNVEAAPKLAKVLGVPVERVTLAKANGHAAP
jgi:ribosome-binding protein aMBF1 (putative translation factor)